MDVERVHNSRRFQEIGEAAVRINKHSVGWILALFIACTSTVGAQDDIVERVNIDYETFTLDNGLTTIVHTDHSTPTVFIGIWYGVGSKDEPDGRTGFAHLFEHLMFQSTENHEGEFFEPFTKAGATGMNGTTSEDRTNYYATVPSGAVDMAFPSKLRVRRARSGAQRRESPKIALGARVLLCGAWRSGYTSPRSPAMYQVK